MVTNPFLQSLHSPAPPSSRWLTERDFATLYAAAEFAAAFRLWFDTTVAISWRLMGEEVERDVPRFFTAFTKCLGDWLKQRYLPAAWIYAHEYGRKVGLHTHLALYVPGLPSDVELRKLVSPNAPDYRREFRKWVKGWPERRIGRPVPKAIGVSTRKTETPWLHWLTTSYLMKGYDCSAVVQAARNSPDGREVLLGDLIAYPWHDPGPVDMKHRVGASRSLGPDRRAIGVPTGFDYLLGPTGFDYLLGKTEGTFSLTPGSVPHTITISCILVLREIKRTSSG